MRAELFGNDFTVGIRNGGSENELYIPVISGTLDDKSDGNVTLTASGDASVIALNAYSLDGKIQLENENYDEEYENSLNPLKVKPEKNDSTQESGENKGCGGSVGGIATFGGLVVTAAVALLLILRGKKEKRYE